MNATEFFTQLWQDYLSLNPQAEVIHNALEQRGEQVINDHVAFRTFNRGPIALKQLEPFLLLLGYEPFEPYYFAAKKIDAVGYCHPDAALPRIFLSELRVEELSEEAQQLIDAMLASIPVDSVSDASIFYRGRLWPAPSYQQYQRLAAESEYAAWLSLLGLRANHFTVSVNHLTSIADIGQMNEFIKQLGYALNASGGEIKGTPDDLLVQSSTLAAQCPMSFANDEVVTVPTCYYEFAQRFTDENGELYQGFVAANADKIFESTDTQGKTKS